MQSLRASQSLFFEDSIKCRLPRNQAATRVEVLLSQLGSARGRDGANSSQQLNFPPLLYTERGKEEEEMCRTSSDCTLN